ncbi:MAG: hypothetical protein HOQ09_07205 [Gemmatimonadaceae bacterium]|nr:hypothetical protein [Gemmatimonadaceae bacterium]
MALWDRLKSELDRAGRVAQGALDEGRIQLEAFRAKQRMDKAAQALGYAFYRARSANTELDTDSYARLSGELAAAEAEHTKLEEDLRTARAARGASIDGPPAPDAPVNPS